MNRTCSGILLVLVSMAVVTGGCRYGMMGPTRIPSPPTYSIGQNQYYNPNNNALVNPGTAAPTPATPGGWLPAGNQASPSTPANSNPAGNGSGTRFDLSSTTLPAARTAANQAVPPAQSPPTTRMSTIAENDPSRLPVSDATGVRAPVQFQTPQWNAGVAATGFQNGQPIARPSAAYPPGNPQTYLGNPRFVGGPAQYRGQPVYTRPGQAPAVLAESTVRMDPNSPNYQSGWRDRDPGSEIMR